MQPIVRGPAMGVVLAAALALTGCADSAPPVIPTAQPSTAPVFATSADALAAAKKSFITYLAVSSEISNDGGMEAQRIAPAVSKKWLPSELASYAKFVKSGQRFTGAMTFQQFRLQSWDVDSDELAEVVAYVCVDVSHTHLLNRAGADITPSSRQDVYPIVANFESAARMSPNLLFSGSTPWSGTNYCS